jgi:hypothetical protein
MSYHNTVTACGIIVCACARARVASIFVKSNELLGCLHFVNSEHYKCVRKDVLLNDVALNVTQVFVVDRDIHK